MAKSGDLLYCCGLTVSNRCFLILVLYTVVSWSGSQHHPLDFGFIRIIQAGIRNLSFPAIRLFSLHFNWHTRAGVWRCVGKVICRWLLLSRTQCMATQNRWRFVILHCSDSGKNSYCYKVFAPDTFRSLLRAQKEAYLDLRVSLYMFVQSCDSGCWFCSVWRSSSSLSSNWRENTFDTWTHTSKHCQCG